MKSRDEHKVDKSKWPKGPWTTEPDRLEWVDETTGYTALIVRTRMGNLCGYVGVSEGHPWYGKNYGDCLQGCPDLGPPKETTPEEVERLRAQAQEDTSEGRWAKFQLENYPQHDRLAKKLYDTGHRRYACDHPTIESVADVHGGVTYTDGCQDDGGPICHASPTPAWWIGFDCAHAGDLVPEMVMLSKRYGLSRYRGSICDRDVYRDVPYVKSEIKRLAAQAAKAEARNEVQ